MTAWEKINELRKEKNLTLARLAILSGVSNVTLTNWHKGKTKPHPLALKKVADALDYNYKDLLELL